MMKNRLKNYGYLKHLLLVVFAFSLYGSAASALDTERPMVDVQSQYQAPTSGDLNAVQEEARDLVRRLHKIKGRLAKKKIPERLRLQFRALEESMQMFQEKLSGLNLSVNGQEVMAFGDCEELGLALKSLYEEALLLYSLNKETSLIYRTKKSRLKNMLTQIKHMAELGHFIVLE